MEVVFWKHKSYLVFMTFIIFIALISSIIFAILAITNIDMLIGCAFMFIVFIIGICCIFINNNFLSKLTFSEDGIKWTRFNKEIMFMNWDEIVEIKQTPAGRATCYLTFDTGQKFMHIDVSSKKMYDAIINICPSGNIKYRIRNLDFLKWYQRK
ncbi:MAG: hypothetical protein IJ301_01740 [Clostridia bacterium]|nr:hypothetical protein [Clostridia bacterium]